MRLTNLKRWTQRWGLRVAILLGSLFWFATPAWSDVIYNYGQNWLFDSASGLYWQTQQIPTATFIPGSGAIATFAQVEQLWDDAGLRSAVGDPLVPQLPAYTPSAYSPQLANLLSFFESDRSANPDRFTQEISLSLSELYLYPPDTIPNDNYEYAVINYRSADLVNGYFYGTTTLGDYGPTNPCPYPADGVCPAFEPAFVVSTTTPVPLPAAVWLLLSGICALDFRQRIRILRQGT